MPSKTTRRKRGEPVRIRTKRLPNGDLLRVFVYDSRGPRGGRTTAEKLRRRK